MAITSLKLFQQRAVESAARMFEYLRGTLDAAGTDAASRATAIHGNGYLLIEAPTGAGKTLMAGSIVERASAADRVVWFWFAPFKGVVEQTASFLREQFPGLRLRTLAEDRNPTGTRAGDAFVTTWQMVATRVKDRRSVRQTGEQNESIDDLIVSLREQGFRIGCVVDEAHHGFHADTQAAVFFRQVLDPDYTILITATPDDADLKDLGNRMQIGNIHRVSVSRADAVGDGKTAGLIKGGIKAVAWRAADGDAGTAELVDFEGVALREGAALHRLIKAELAAAGVGLTPLMLVQVDSTKNSVERAKEKIKALGFADAQIAVHTSDEPDPSLLALANDERREVLIFKMAVALGFDAPRAWTLVSMRAAKDEDFGVQLVGRILRVHRRCQGRVLPEPLKYGYVLLADIEAQGGLDKAGQRINKIQTAYAAVSPTTVIVQVGDKTVVQQTGPDNQTSLLPVDAAPFTFTPPAGPARPFVPPAGDGAAEPLSLFAGDSQSQTEPRSAISGVVSVAGALAAALRTPPQWKAYRYPLRADVPRRFQTQDLPEDVDIDEGDISHHFLASADDLFRAVHGLQGLKVNKLTVEIFTQATQMELGYQPPSPAQVRREAQSHLLKLRFVSPKSLRESLQSRLRAMLEEKGYPNAGDTEMLGRVLDMLIAARPALLNDAYKRAVAKVPAVGDAEALPETLESDVPLDTSRLNVYRVLPATDFNTWERQFGQYLDDDETDTVLWWHRNQPHKPWSINVLMDNGRGFFPDFIVGIRGRQSLDGGMLADTKYAWETAPEFPKLLAEHAKYGRAVVLTKDHAKAGWQVVGLDKAGRPCIERPFRIAEASRY